MQLNTGEEYVDVDGMLVEKDCLRIAEAIKVYDPNLELLAVDPARADFSDAPYVLMEKCSDGEYRMVSRFWELNDDVLATIEAADMQRQDLIAVINGRNERIKRDNERRYREMMDERADLVAHIAGMKSKYTWRDGDDIVTFYDDRPTERKPA